MVNREKRCHGSQEGEGLSSKTINISISMKSARPWNDVFLWFFFFFTFSFLFLFFFFRSLIDSGFLMFFGVMTVRMQLKLTPRQERDRCLV